MALRSLVAWGLSLAFILASGFSSAWALTEDIPVSISFDGEPVVFEVPPIIRNSRTFVPVRFVLERINAKVGWNGETRAVTITYGDRVVVLTIDTPRVLVDGEAREIDVAPFILNSRTMVPLRFVAEVFGFVVHWDAKSQTVAMVPPPPLPAPVAQVPLPTSSVSVGALRLSDPPPQDRPQVPAPETAPLHVPTAPPESGTSAPAPVPAAPPTGSQLPRPGDSAATPPETAIAAPAVSTSPTAPPPSTGTGTVTTSPPPQPAPSPGTGTVTAPPPPPPAPSTGSGATTAPQPPPATDAGTVITPPPPDSGGSDSGGISPVPTTALMLETVGTPRVGYSFTARVRLLGAVGVKAAAVLLIFDASKLEVIQIRSGSILEGITLRKTYDNLAGRLEYITAVTGSRVFSGDGTYFEVVFRAKASGDTTLTLASGDPAGPPIHGVNGSVQTHLGSAPVSISR